MVLVNKKETEVLENIRSARVAVASAIKRIDGKLEALNQAIHSHPELCYEEIFAHATITDFLESLGFTVQRHAYGLETAFVAEAGSGGRLVVICAEYDALPGIGHGCGHNLISTASIAAFIGAAEALLAVREVGRVRILGTPAEEGGGGKIKLIEAGAFSEDVAASIMCHALPLGQLKAGWGGVAGFRTLASRRFHVEFHGKNAHAGQEPWNGANALDAAVGAYNAASMLRQQIRPEDRIQSVIEEGGKVPNIIPDYTRMNWGIRSTSIQRVDILYRKMQACIQGAALASGCTYEITGAASYMELRVNRTLCHQYIEEMDVLGEKILFMEDQHSSAGTDMGNVSYVVPGFHGIFGIPTAPGIPVHHKDFEQASGTRGAYRAAVTAGKGLAMLAFKVLIDPALADAARDDFISTKKT